MRSVKSKKTLVGILALTGFVMSVGGSAKADSVGAGYCGGNFGNGGDPNRICISSTWGNFLGETYSRAKLDAEFAQINSQISAASGAPQPLSPVAASTVTTMISTAVTTSQAAISKEVNDLHIQLATSVGNLVRDTLNLPDSNLTTDNQRKLEDMIRKIVREEIQKSFNGSGN